jgi:hypothetical protein
VSLNIIEIKQPDLNAQLVAESIAAQLEKRVSFRRALKQAIGRTMKLGAKGLKRKFPVASAARKSPVRSIIMRELSLCRPSVRTLITDLPKQRPPTVASASRFGFTEAKSSMTIADRARKGAPNNAVAKTR